MVLNKIIRICVCRSSFRDGEHIIRKTILTEDGRTIKKLTVAKYGFLQKLLLNNLQSFTYWPISAHFNDILGKNRFKMGDDDHDLLSDMGPPKRLGMKVLDTSAFKKKCKINGIKVPLESISFINRKMKSSVFHMPKLNSIVDLREDDEDTKTHKLILLHPGKIKTANDFTDSDRHFLEEKKVNLNSFQQYNIELCYDNWTATEIIRAVLPDSTESISGFSIIGHIAHLNLKKEVMEYKNLIAKVIMDKNPTIKTVVNKTNEIDNTYRNFKMELLAGEDNMITQAKEHGFIYELDFSKVYWNPRLEREHRRVVDEVQQGDIVYDVFAGIGPFAIPAAKVKKAVVYANDLNPDSYQSLCKNIKLNKVKNELKCSNLDGREFIRTVLKPSMEDHWKKCRETGTKTSFKVVMNLPALAIEFTDAFRSLFKDIDKDIQPSSPEMLPYMYIYCFSKSETPEDDVKQRLENIIGSQLPPNHTIRIVRNVAPNKEMLCVSFHMPANVLFGKTDGDSPVEKKRKLDDS